MNNKTSSSRTKARTSPDEMHPLDDLGQRKGMGEVNGRTPHPGSIADRIGKSDSETSEPVGSAPRNPGKTNRTSSQTTGGFSHGSTSDGVTGRGSGSNSRSGSSDEGVNREKRGV